MDNETHRGFVTESLIISCIESCSSNQEDRPTNIVH
jgi:hypothetical protein